MRLFDCLTKYERYLGTFKDSSEDTFILGYLLGNSFSDNSDKIVEIYCYMDKLRQRGIITQAKKIEILKRAVVVNPNSVCDYVYKICKFLKSRHFNLLNANRCCLCKQNVAAQEESFITSCCKTLYHGQCIYQELKYLIENDTSIVISCVTCQKELQRKEIFKIGQFVQQVSKGPQVSQVIQEKNELHTSQIQSGNTWEYNGIQTQEEFLQFFEQPIQQDQFKRNGQDSFHNIPSISMNPIQIQNMSVNSRSMRYSTVDDMGQVSNQTNQISAPNLNQTIAVIDVELIEDRSYDNRLIKSNRRSNLNQVSQILFNNTNFKKRDVSEKMRDFPSAEQQQQQRQQKQPPLLQQPDQNGQNISENNFQTNYNFNSPN